ncbi:acyltransferase family protein [Sanguibacter suaedae]|uniref:Acyltransferase n=1 Tax=Sanguibacter suaedae TaxID=2795737 RepID=A0A934ID74_9MICO|nr:acyltransferase [Sanguibacter suaedae]MBI9116197.1 acyltransferase [Sanguibacter suaedae]
MRNKDAGIESLRGIAIVLMVAGHVVGATPDRGLQVPDSSFWRFSYLALEDLRMPLFAFISGFVYAYRPVGDAAGGRSLMRGKVRRLLVPMVTVGTVYFLVQLFTPGTNSKPDPSDYWQIFFFGYEHLWFVQAIFLVFVTVGTLDLLGWNRTPARWAMTLAASTVVGIAVRLAESANLFSINGALRLLPFFILGYGVHRHARALSRHGSAVVGTCAGVFVLSYALALSGILLSWESPPMVGRAIGTAVGMSGAMLLTTVRSHLAWTPLAYIGNFAFGIYLLHVFGAAGTRILLERIGVESTLATFVLCLAAGIGLPLLFEKTLGRLSVVSWLFLGQRPTARAHGKSDRERRRNPTSAAATIPPTQEDTGRSPEQGGKATPRAPLS